MPNPVRGLFITGTNTGIGKTHVTALIARRLSRDGVRVGVYKPACSGSERNADGHEIWSDVVRLSDSLGHRFPDDWICPQRFTAALSPPDAARKEGRIVDRGLLRTGIRQWRDVADVVLVEGVGGWRSPIANGETVADLAADFQFPVVLVAGLELGGINHALLALESMERRGLPIAGIVLNQHRPDVPPEVVDATAAGIRGLTAVPVLATVFHEKNGPRTPESRLDTVDWNSLCGLLEA